MTIKSTDQGYILPNGTRLALIDNNGNVVDQRPQLATELFDAAGAQYLAAIEKLLGKKSAEYAANTKQEAA